MRTIPDIPQKLKGRSLPAVVEVRGEVYMTHEEFIALNKRQAAAEEPVYANPRNSAAAFGALVSHAFLHEPRFFPERAWVGKQNPRFLRQNWAAGMGRQAESEVPASKLGRGHGSGMRIKLRIRVVDLPKI